MPTLLRRNSEACAARRRKRDATRTLAALITIYLLTNTLNLLITIMEFINPDVLGSLGDGWTYKWAILRYRRSKRSDCRYLADLSSVLTISSTAFRLPVYFHCNGDIRAQIREFARNCFIEDNEKKKLVREQAHNSRKVYFQKKLALPITCSSTESVLWPNSLFLFIICWYFRKNTCIYCSQHLNQTVHDYLNCLKSNMRILPKRKWKRTIIVRIFYFVCSPLGV